MLGGHQQASTEVVGALAHLDEIEQFAEERAHLARGSWRVDRGSVLNPVWRIEFNSCAPAVGAIEISMKSTSALGRARCRT